MTIEFPLYIKFKQAEIYFRIDSMETFEELRIIGKHYQLEEFKAKILPDRNYIYDLIHNTFVNCEYVSEEVYYNRKKIAVENLSKI